MLTGLEIQSTGFKFDIRINSIFTERYKYKDYILLYNDKTARLRLAFNASNNFKELFDGKIETKEELINKLRELIDANL